MALTRLQNIISSVEGRILYVNPDDFDSTDAIDNKGNSPLRPFKTIARAVLEVARYSYVSAGNADDKFDQFTIMLYPGDHIVDNRPGSYAYGVDGNGNYVGELASVPFSAGPVSGQYGWSDTTKQYGDLYKITNSVRGGLIIPRGVSLVGMDLRKTKIRPKFVPAGGTNSVTGTTQINYTASNTNPNQLTITGVTNGPDGVNNINDLIIGSAFKKGVAGYSIISQFTAGAGTTYDPVTGELVLDIGTHTLTTNNSIRIAVNSLTFTCASDGNVSQVTYPRTTDPAYDTTISIQAVTATTITVNVGTSSETSAHTFVSGAANSITAVDTSLKIAEGTVITDVSCNTGSSSITVGISKPHGYTAADVTNSTNIGVGVVVDLPYEDDNSRTALFRITGGCYFWQFSIFDGDPAGVYRETSVKPQTNWTLTDDVQYSHTKLTVFEYASLHDLKYFYRKVSDVISVISCEKIEAKIQENRIVGALADAVDIASVTRNNNVVTVNLDQDLEITSGNFVAIQGAVSTDSGINAYYIGQRQVATVNTRSQFTFNISSSSVSALDALETDADAATSGFQVSYTPANASVQVEIDTVESASPYIFNVSLRSTYGICGMHADGSRATGFKSMVVAQYTGISLQKDDTAFLKYREGSNTFSTQIGDESLHTDPEAIYNPLQRSYHVKASNRAVIQAVSVFAVGYADHFIAEDGGDMSITNSNSNFGMNAMRSIGFSDQAFKKDALGKITHIIPPRNVESTLSNSYYESVNAVKTQTYGAANSNNSTRIYLSGRDNFLGITSGGSNFTSGNVTVVDPSGTNRTVALVADSSGVVTSASFSGNTYGTFQPGDEITIPTNAADGVGLDCVLSVGDGLDKEVGKFTVGRRVLDKDGSTITDKIFVPLYANSSATATTERSAEISPVSGNVFDFDFATPSTTAGGWYLNVSSGASNQIYSAINGNTKYGLTTITTTPTSYIKRIVDERVDDDKIYRLRYVTQTENGLASDPAPSFPQRGYVLQVKRGQGILGRGDRFTDGANLLLLNKYFLAHESIARWINDNSGQTELTTNARRRSCIDDLVNIIEAVAYNLRYGGNDQVVTAADKYVNGAGAGAGGIEGERDETVDILDNYLKPLMTYAINNGVTTSPVNTPSIGSIENNNLSGDNATNYDLPNIVNPVTISGEEQLINVFGGCTNVRDAAFTLIDIIVTALGTDSGGAGSLPTSTTPAAAGETYNRISGHEYNDVYYVYEVEEVTPFRKATSTTAEVPGVYYLTVLKGSIPVSTQVLPGNTFKLSQNIDNIYPVIDLDNIVNDPIIADSVADPITIGVVNTTTGLDSNDVTADTSFSITKESLSYFFDEYLNNELEWDWTGSLTSNSVVEHKWIDNGAAGAHTVNQTVMESGIGNGEVRKIPLNPRRPTDTIEVELRRPSTIRSGNHTFEYVGFGPGNYSTGFPIKQNKVLTNDEVKYSQSLKEQGGIAFYSGLNSQGDLYIGNTVINAVTGKTTENQITELNTLTIKDNLTVIGGSGNTITSTFQGPVTFLKETTFDSEDNFFSAIKIRNPDGIVSKIVNRDSISALTGEVVGDITLTTNPVNGGNSGWVYTADNEWREQGIIGTEKIHSYKDGTNYTLNVGSDLGTASTDFNDNYDLDVTTNQRIGTNLDIGTAVNAAQPGISSTKQSRLHIAQSWTDSNVEYRPIEIAVAASPSGAVASRLIEAKVGTDSKFSVDEDGNVTIPDTATYGLSKKAFSTTITTAGTANTANNIDSITNLGANPLTISVVRYQGGSVLSPINRSFGFRMTNQLGSFIYYGASAATPHVSGSPRDADVGGLGNVADFNTRSMVVYINGVIQQPYFDYHFDGSYLYFDSALANGARIDIRCLAN